MASSWAFKTCRSTTRNFRFDDQMLVTPHLFATPATLLLSSDFGGSARAGCSTASRRGSLRFAELVEVEELAGELAEEVSGLGWGVVEELASKVDMVDAAIS
jgi:hypothetical protein